MTVIGLISRLSSTRCSSNEYLGDDDDTKMFHPILTKQLLDFHMKTHKTDKFAICT